MFFSCQLAFDTGQKGDDLAVPGAAMGRFLNENYSLLPAQALDRLYEMMLATAVVSEGLFTSAVFLKWSFKLIRTLVRNGCIMAHKHLFWVDKVSHSLDQLVSNKLFFFQNRTGKYILAAMCLLK